MSWRTYPLGRVRSYFVNVAAPRTNEITARTKSDLREDKETIEKLAERRVAPITEEQAKEVVSEFGLVGYVESSSLTQSNLTLVMEEAVRAVLNPSPTKTNKSKKAGSAGDKRCSLS